MSGQQKQFAYVAGGIVLILLLLAVGYYYIFPFKKTSPPSGLLPNTSDLPTSPAVGGVTPQGGQGDQAGDYQTTLFQIHDKPTVSFSVFTRDGVSYARFIEQGSGHVYEYNFDTKQKIRISNTSIPQIETAVWAKDGNTVVFQYLEKDTIKSAIGQLATTSAEGSYKKITFLPDGLGPIALSPSGSEVAFVTANQNGGVVGVSRSDGTGGHSVFTSTLVRWLISWPSADNLLVETPLSMYGGAAFSVNVRTGERKTLTITTGPFSGLIGASDGISYLYAPSWSRGTTRYNSKDNTEFALFAMNTIPEKCSFVATSTEYALCGSGSSSNAPILSHFEEWLRGDGFVEDSIYVVSFNQGFWTPPVRTEDLGDLSFDVEHIETDSRMLYAAFKERQSAMLWGIWLRPELFI